jgi:hypothetical protein
MSPDLGFETLLSFSSDLGSVSFLDGTTHVPNTKQSFCQFSINKIAPKHPQHQTTKTPPLLPFSDLMNTQPPNITQKLHKCPMLFKNLNPKGPNTKPPSPHVRDL